MTTGQRAVALYVRVATTRQAEGEALVAEVGDWSADMALLIHWLCETGMRPAEALQVGAEDIHSDRQRATLSRGVKRGKVRTGLDVAFLSEGSPGCWVRQTRVVRRCRRS
jgi:integrase